MTIEDYSFSKTQVYSYKELSVKSEVCRVGIPDCVKLNKWFCVACISYYSIACFEVERVNDGYNGFAFVATSNVYNESSTCFAIAVCLEFQCQFTTGVIRRRKNKCTVLRI